MREYFYYFRDDENRPIVTGCLLIDGQEYSRGVALCSRRDNPCKKSGRKIARTRAMWALKNKASNCEILSQKATSVLIDAKISGEFFDYVKSAFKPPVNVIETKLMGIATV
jgi:hypothetical protein